MDFRISLQNKAFAEEVRSFFDTHLTDEIVASAWRTGTLHSDELHKVVAAKRWIGATWPTEVGGLGMNAADFAAFWETAHYVGAPVDGQQLTEMVGYVLVQRGTAQQKRDLIPQILSGDTVISLGFTEAESGSDVAAACTQAKRVPGGYQITGSKMFTTLAHIADYVFLLTRTGPQSPKHQGLTMFLVPLDSPGIEIQPVETFGGERTNATYYDDVFVPDELRVGDEGDGWGVLVSALDVERASVGGWVGQVRRVYDDLIQALRETQPAQLRSGALRDMLAGINVQIEAAAALADRVYCAISRGGVPSVEAAMTKLLVTDVLKGLSHVALDILGPVALLSSESFAAPVGGRLEHAFRHAQISTIYGGSNEIQRNIIALRALGLPSSDRIAR